MSALTPSAMVPPMSSAEPAQGLSLADLAAAWRRRRLLMAVLFGAVFGIGLLVAWWLPSVYRSTATILIQEQDIPPELVRSTVTSFADERIQVISQQVMTRSVLLDLVDRHQLYGPRIRERASLDEILERMREDIRIKPISADITDRRTGSQSRSTIAFSLSFESTVPSHAQKVANELSSLFLNENLKNRRQKAAETTSFLQEELDRLNEHISEGERKLSEFKRRNQGRLPELALVNQQTRERTEAELLRVDREIQSLQERATLLAGQFALAKPNNPLIGTGAGGGLVLEPEDRLASLQTQLASLVGVYSEDHPDIRRMRREIASLGAETGLAPSRGDRELRLAELEAQQTALRRRYADDHPDLRAIQRRIDALGRAEDTSPSQPGRRERKPDNPVYVTLKSQLAATQADLQSLRVMRQQLRGKLAEVDARMVQSPEVEREYLELARDQDSSRLRFRELREKLMQASIAQELERESKSERFTLIDPAVYPEKPVRPNRAAVSLIGLVLAALAALGAAWLAESTDRRVHGAAAVARILQVPVLVSLPLQRSEAALQQGRRRRLALAAGLLLAGGLGMAALHLYYMPVEVAWYGLLRRLSV